MHGLILCSVIASTTTCTLHELRLYIIIGVVDWHLPVQNKTSRQKARSFTCALNVLFSNKKTSPYGRLRPCHSESTVAVSHYCPIKAAGAMWAEHVTTNTSTVCCISTKHTVTQWLEQIRIIITSSADSTRYEGWTEMRENRSLV